VLRIGVKLPPRITKLGEFVADVAALEAAGADSIWLDADAQPPVEWFIELGALVAVTHRVGLGLIASPPASEELIAALDAIHALSGGRGLAAHRSGSTLRVAAGRWPGAEAEPWSESEAGKDRAAWRQVLEEHSGSGRAGLVVAWDPRVVDLLRNSDAEDDRSDLLISTG
jgi:hypothetical protein